MAVSQDFTSSALDLNGQVTIGGPTAIAWGADGRLYVTEVNGTVNALTVAFGDKNPGDDDPQAKFYVTEAEEIDLVQTIPNFNDDGNSGGENKRQVTGVDVTAQFDANGDPVIIDGKPGVVVYVTSSDSRIGAGTNGADTGLDTNSGIITKLTQQPDGSWTAVDLVRGLARSEENHATNGLEVIQEIDPVTGKLISERMIVASGGNANTGAPSNNFAGQQETPYSAAILEVDLTELAGMDVLTDPVSGRQFVYDLPTLNDPTRNDATENDPFGGNDGLNSAKLLDDGPVQIYSAGYRNAFDVEVTEDGRVWTYDNGANNGWGGRPAGEDADGDTNAIEAGENQTPADYVATNYVVEDNNEIEGNFNPQNWDGLHEITRSDDLMGEDGIMRALSAGKGGAQTYQWNHPDFADPLMLVYGGHPNPTRAEGAKAGLLYSPKAGTEDSLLMVSNVAKANDTSDFLEVVAWLKSIGYSDAQINSTVVAVEPGVLYSEDFKDGFGGGGASGRPDAPGVFSLVEDTDGPVGLPVDIDEIVETLNPIEGDYQEAGFADSSVDTNKGSVNGLAEYTSTILDNPDAGIKMSGALWATTFSGNYLIIGRNDDGIVETTQTGDAGRTVAADKLAIQAGGGPLGIAAIGDDLTAFGGQKAFQGTVWSAIYKQNGPIIEIFQPGNPDTNPLLPVYAGQEPSDPTDHDLDGVNHINDPFEFSDTNGFDLSAGEKLVLDFQPRAFDAEFGQSLGAIGMLGAALDGETPNRDALTADDGFAEADRQDGLFDDGGNLILGANAPKVQVKEVQDGSAVGSDNDARDAVHTGVKLSPDTQRVTAELDIVNWVADQPANEADNGGRVTGISFGDGTQSNFIRLVFGDIDGGQLGLELGIETGDTYTVLGTSTDQGFIDALTGFDPEDGEEKTAFGQKVVTLQLEVSGIGDDYVIAGRYKVAGETEFQTITLTGDASIPSISVLRAVLDGTHQISDDDATPTTANSGAAIGIVAEKDDGASFDAVDFNEMRIEAFGNEIAASDAAAVSGATGTAEVDTVVYDGSDQGVLDLPDDIENFDGSQAGAGFTLAANDQSNRIKTGAGADKITTGAGADVVSGSLSDLSGDLIDDFSREDALVIEGLTQGGINSLAFADGSAVLIINGQSITLDGPDFTPENFQASDGASYFDFEDTADGLRITSRAPLSPVIAINAGGANASTTTGTLRDTELTFLGDTGGFGDGEGPGFRTTGANKAYDNSTSTAFDFPDTDLDDILESERSNANDFGYEIDLPNGTYLVDLIFAEIFHGFHGSGTDNTGSGNRVFDVEIEGQEVFSNLDVQDEAGGAGKQLVKSHLVTVTDGTLNIELNQDGPDADQAKLSGLVVWDTSGSFTPVDATAPVVDSITLENPQNFSDGERTATVVVTDETAFDVADFAGLSGTVLQFSGYQPDAIADPVVTLSQDGKTATLTFEVTGQNNGWADGVTGTISLAAGTFNDAAGNGSAAASGGFVVQSNLDSLVRGNVVRAINLGTTDTAPGGGTAGLDTDPLDGGAIDNNRYGGALTDSLIKDAFDNPVVFEADSGSYHTAPKGNGDLNANVDGELGTTGSNAGGVDLDESAYHTYRDSAANAWISTFEGFANGSYIVELHFAELFQTAAGTRVGKFEVNGVVFDGADAFDVSGNPLTGVGAGDGSYDAFDAGGGADVPTFIRKAVTVTDGTITVDVDASGAGQAGYSAIVVYDAADPDAAPELSIADVTASEGDMAEITITRSGSLDEAVSVDVGLTFDGAADASDVGALTPTSVTFAEGEAQKTVTLQIADDDLVEGAETLSVTLSDATDGAVIADGTATVTITASDNPLQVQVGAPILHLDFEGVEGEPLDVGGFDGALGSDDSVTIVDADAEVTGGKLVVQTAEGDINDIGGNASKNDFTKSVDLSDPALNEIYLSTRFDNPFDEATLAENGVTDGVVPNFAQQGIVIGNGTQADADQVKLVWGGVASGTGTQIWSKGSAANGGISQTVPFAAMVPAGTGLFDVAAVEMTLLIDKGAGTVAQFVTLFDDAGAVLGGVRPVAEAGFAAAGPIAMPADVLANLTSAAELTHVGVTSSDNSQPPTGFGSFEASWDFLDLSSPQFVDPVTATITGMADVTEGGEATYDITLSEPATDSVTVTVDVTGGAVNPATLPQDAALTSDGTQVVLTFAPGDQTQQIAVAVSDDTLPELAETFEVAISGVGVTAGGAGSVVTTIAANDGDVDSVDGVAVGAGPVNAAGDFSGVHDDPTAIGTLAEGATTIVATQQGDNAAGGRDRDFITFKVAEGQELTGIVLKAYTGDSEGGGVSQGFIAIQEGSAIGYDRDDPAGTGAEIANLLGGYVYSGSDVEGVNFNDGNLLDDLGAGAAENETFIGFSGPLSAGTYTIWLNQGADLPTSTTLELVSAPAEDVILSISDADVTEGEGASLAFALAATKAFTGDMVVTFQADGEASNQTVTFDQGAGVLIIAAANDDINDDDDIVTITLTGATTDGQDIAISETSRAATGTIFEDDPMFPTLAKGDFVFGVNAGAKEEDFTDEDGNLFDPSDATEWTGAKNSGAPDGNALDYTGDSVDNADDTVYETEHWGGAEGTAPLAFMRSGIPAGDYILTIKLAEIFSGTTGEGQRIFDLTVNGVQVADDLDLFAEVGKNAALDIDVAVTIPDEVDGTGTLEVSATATVDNAKISGLALFEAPADPLAVTVSVEDVVAAEEDAAAEVTFTRTGNIDADVTVTFSVTGDSAVAGTDFEVPTDLTATIPAGQNSVTVPITLIDNTVEDGALTFDVAITDVQSVGATTIAGTGETATVTITDGEAPDPEDIDGDGILNAADPFAYDGQNGAAKVLGAGVSFRQDFDAADATSDMFGAEAGFSGIVVNPDFTPANASAADPYGDSTTEAFASVSDGTLDVTASEFDLFGSGNGASNTVRDNYQSAADVSGVDAFTVEAKVANPFFGGAAPQSFASFGVILGAGGVDDYVKFVFGGSNAGPRIQLAQENSLTGGKENNLVANIPENGDIDTALAQDIIFSVAIDAIAMTLQGTAIFLDENDNELGSISTPVRAIDPAGSLAAAMAGINPLTGGTGGLAYGISITEWDGAPSFTASWDYLEIAGPEPVNVAPTAVTLTPATISLPETTDTATGSVKLADIAVTDEDNAGGVNVLGLAGEGAESFDIVAGDNGPELHLAQGAVLSEGAIDVTITVDDESLGTGIELETTFTLTVDAVDTPPTEATPIADLAADEDAPFSFTVPDGTFADDDGEAALTLAATLSDGGALPDWLAFDAETGVFSGTPAQADVDAGALEVTVTATDASNQTATSSFTLTPQAVNDGPVVGDDTLAATSGVGVVFTFDELLDNDTDEENDPLSITEVRAVSGGTATLTDTGIAFVPDAGFSGDAVFEYDVTDGALSDTGTVTVNVASTPDGVTPVAFTGITGWSSQDKEPGAGFEADGASLRLTGNVWKKIAFPAGYEITADTVLRFDLKVDLESEMQGIGLDTDNDHNNAGTVLYKLAGIHNLNAVTSYEYDDLYTGGVRTYEIPIGDLEGQDFAFITFVNDSDRPPEGDVTFSNLALVQKDSGQPPVLEGPFDPVTFTEEATITQADGLLVAGRFDDEDPASLTYSLVGAPEGLSIDDDGFIAGTLPTDVAGDFDITVVATDAQGNEGTGTIALTVENVNDAPVVAGSIPNATFRQGEAVSIAVPADLFTDVDSAAVEYSIAGLPAGLNYDPVSGLITDEEGSPAPGTYAISVTASDGEATSADSVDFTLTVADASEAVATPVSISELRSYRSSQDKDAAAFDILSGGDGAALFGNTWKEFDFPAGYTITANTVLRVSVTLGDTDSEAVAIGFDTDDNYRNAGTHVWQLAGTQTLNSLNQDFAGLYTGPGTIYEIPIGFLAGEDPGKFVILNDDDDASDGTGSVTFADIALVETGQSQAPVVTAQADATAQEDTSLAIDLDEIVAITDGDTDVADLTITATSDLPGLDLTVADGVLTGDLPADAFGEVAVTITATDPQGNSGQATVTLNVENVNDAPVAAGEIVDTTVREGDPVSIAIPADLFTDADGDDLELTIDNLPQGLNYDPGTGLITDEEGSPAPGTYEIKVSGSDGQATSAESVDFTLTVAGPTDDVDVPVPFANLQTYRANQDKDAAAFQILDGGAGVELFGNTWKAFDFPAYTITENTVLRVALTLGATDSEAVAIGLDTNNNFKDAGTFIWQLAGTQTLGALNQDFAGQYDGPGTVYDIPIGFLAGEDPGQFVLVNDDDNASNGTGSVTFANLTLVEAPEPDPNPPVFTSDPAFGVDENVAAAGTVQATDADTDDVAYSIAGGDDADLFDIDADTGALSFKDAPDFERPDDTGADNVYDLTVRATAGTGFTDQDVTVTVNDVDEPFDPALYAPDGDLDGDDILNAADSDIDGDGVANQDDPFAYDVADGMTLAAGEEKVFGFDLDGTIYENGMTGFLQGTTNGGVFDEDTGATTVDEGVLRVDPVTSGDTGGSNNPQDDAVVGVKNGTFTASAVVVNPWAGDAPNANSFDQIGLVLGVDSADMIKMVFGQSGQVVEFQKQDADTGTKFGGATANANIALPAGVTLDNFASAEITFAVVSTDAASATVTGSISFLDDGGAVLGSLGPIEAPIGGALAAALADDAQGVAVGFTHVNGGGAPSFVAELDSLTIREGVGPVDDVAPAAAIALTNPVTADADLVVAVTLTDDGGIDPATLGDDDLSLSFDGLPVAVTVSFDGFANGVATYSVAAPPNGWTDGLDIGVTLAAGAVADTAANVTAETSQSLTLEIGGGSAGGDDVVVYRINAGGAEVAASDGGLVWAGDVPVSGPNTYLQTGNDRADTGGTATSGFAGVPDAVFATARSSNSGFSYDIPVGALDGNGNYEIRLYFAEIFGTAQAGDYRVFDAVIEGSVPAAFNNIDPGALFGADAGVLTAQIAVTDGELNLDMLIGDQSGPGGKQNPILNAVEIVKLDGDIDGPPNPADPSFAVDRLDEASGVDTGGTYQPGAIGSATLSVMAGSDNVGNSNFSGGSFQLANTGDKQIAGLFIDFRDALYRNSVVDFDGSGGDTAAKLFQIDGANVVGAEFGSVAETYFLAGEVPIEDSDVSGSDVVSPVSGGYRGLLMKFDGSDGGFAPGESVGFSGDMDPNSVAGLPKNGAFNLNEGASWDVGGVSGAEIIGSSFTVLFDDGTTATGYLGSDDSQAGSTGSAVEGAQANAVTVTVNGAGSGVVGSYGGAVPEIIVSGEAGTEVKVVMTKGFDPVANPNVDQLVTQRLLDAHPEFAVNNAADFQTVNVTIGQDGTVTVPAGAFDYNTADPGGVTVDGFATLPIAVAAAAVESAADDAPLGPVDRVYLQSNGTPVEDTGGGNTGTDGYFEMIGSGSNARFKIQFEDPNVANGGTDPGGAWTYFDDEDEDGEQGGFQGTGYYLFGNEDSPANNQSPPANSILEYTIFIPEGEGGVYSLRVRASRDTSPVNDEGEPTIEGDKRNDVWVKIDDDAEALQVTDTNSVSSQGFVKLFGAGSNGNWSFGRLIDSVSEEEPNFQASFELEPGLHTISFAGRSQGYHADFFDLYKGTGNGPGTGASNSAFVEGDPPTDGGGDTGGGTSGEIVVAIDQSSDDTDQGNSVNLTKGDLELGDNGRDIGLRFTGIDLESLEGADITDAWIGFVNRPSGGSQGDLVANIFLEDSLSPQTYSGGDGPVGRDEFDFVPWTDDDVPGPNEGFRTPNLADLLEKFIADNEDALSDDDDLAFRIEDDEGVRKAQSFDGGTAPVLHIQYDLDS